MKELSELRDRLAEARKSGKRMMPVPLRLAVGRAALRLREEEGLTGPRIATHLGINKGTVYSWTELARSRDSSLPRSAQIRPVAIAAARPSCLLTVRLLSGLEVLGVSVEDIIKLEKAFS